LPSHFCGYFKENALVERMMSHIRFSTDILQRLGEELNPSPEQGILELVKNAYDADARTCEIELIKTSELGGTVTIRDDGTGMTAKEINDGWLVLGRSSKTKSQRTPVFQRIPVGSKGLGRLAALRMGANAKLITRPSKQSRREYRLEIDWDNYSSVSIVEDVELRIAEEHTSKPRGTEITLEHLNLKIGRMEVKRLARSLVLLADPFGEDPSGFTPVLHAPEFSDLEKIVRNRYFDDADYHLIAEVDGRGISSAKLVDWRGELLFSADHGELTKKIDGRNYECPPTRFDLWNFILAQDNFSLRNATLGEVREWLRSFGGVHLYENGLRVSPYGNPGNDWLELNLRRARSPEERPSTNNSIGRVSVTDSDGLLMQKTDRSGFIENESFEEIKLFAQDALDWMANRRIEIAEKRRSAQRQETKTASKKSKKNLDEIIERASPKQRVILRDAVAAYDRSREREVKALKKEVQLYRTLSTAGITAATFAHESSGNPIKAITQAILAIERRALKIVPEEFRHQLDKPVGIIKKSIDSLSVLGSATLRLVDHAKRRVGRVNVHEVTRDMLDTYRPFLSGRDVDVTLTLADGNPYLQGSEAAIESIVTNLLNNALTALEESKADPRKILIKTKIQDEYVVLSVEDNGPGIQGIGDKDIWLPGRTTRTNGTGLGLTIVRDAVADLGGSAEVIVSNELGGAEFIIKLPILGV
jgi:signal transduction histidine kinase